MLARPVTIISKIAINNVKLTNTNKLRTSSFFDSSRKLEKEQESHLALTGIADHALTTNAHGFELEPYDDTNSRRKEYDETYTSFTCFNRFSPESENSPCAADDFEISPKLKIVIDNQEPLITFDG